MQLVDQVTRSRAIERSLARVCFFRRANAWVKLPEDVMLRLEDERGDFWWLLVRDQSSYRDVFAFRYSEVRHLLIPGARVERHFQGRFIDVGWNISIKEHNRRYLLVVHGNTSEQADISHARNDRTAVARLLEDADVVAAAVGNARLVQRVSTTGSAPGEFDVDINRDARVRAFRRVTLRYGQPQFRRQLLDVYQGRCAVTGCDIIETLEAAHIVPYRGRHADHIANGLLLRSDIHLLFDAGLIAARPTDYQLVIASRLMNSDYSELSQRALTIPRISRHRPSIDALALRLSIFQSVNPSDVN